MDLREERRDRILTADTVPLALNEVKPVAIVNVAVDSPAAAEDVHGDLLQASPTQSRRQVLESHLGRNPEDGGKLLKQVFIARGLFFELISESTQPVSLLPLLLNAPRQCVELVSKVLANASAR